MKRLDSLDKFTDTKLKLIQTNIRIIEKGGTADITLVQAGKQAMDKIRGIPTRFLTIEEQFQVERE